MRSVDDFYDYELIDATMGERLERWGDIILIRPDPQIIWDYPKRDKRWKSPHAIYHRSQSGGGYWEKLKNVPDFWSIKYRDLTFNLKPMGFKHTGLFPEQAVNWNLMRDVIRKSPKKLNVLNLFAYTGGATVACLKSGASVTHVDASKGMVGWAKENATLSGVADRSVRWLVDDCLKFVEREIRRNRKYDGVVMDPPSYGRGPGGEVWKLEQHIGELLNAVSQILSDDAKFFIFNSYTAGLSPSVLNYMVKNTVLKNKNAVVHTDEIGLAVTQRDIILPCGNTTVWLADC
ncbi:MAG: class I SAM-dependent methyltransferase [bacterium]|nr:class I SAM-dependent methyltransferase [bacterium]